MRLGLAIDLDTCVGCHACAVACKEWNGESLMGGAPDYDAWGKAPSGTWYNRIRHYELEGDPSFSPHRCGSVDRSSGTEPHPHPSPLAERARASMREPFRQQLAGELKPCLHPLEGEGTSLAQGEVGMQPLSKTINVPMSCMHCEEAHCVTVCPTGASYKRAEDGIVLVDPSRCMGCNYCAWACPYGARELDQDKGVMKKCTLCVDRIYDQQLPEEERQPACVLACPTHARHFGDYDDPASKVSTLSAARGRQDMLPDLGYRPTNAYLSPRKPAQVVPELPLRKGLSDKAREFVNRLIQL
jgi:Fe-S-cluster-containing dehydrogenase component